MVPSFRQPVVPPLQHGDSQTPLGLTLELGRLGTPWQKDTIVSWQLTLDLQQHTCMCSLRAWTPWHMVRHLGQRRPIS